jgi:hypothetical protein
MAVQARLWISRRSVNRNQHPNRIKNMKTNIAKVWQARLVLLSTLLISTGALAGEVAARPMQLPASETTFEQCNFEFTDSPFFQRASREPVGKDYRVIGDPTGCTLMLTIKKFETSGGAKVALFILDLSQLKENLPSQGFYKNRKGTWQFKGNPVGITFVSFKKLSFKERRTGDEVMLIGRQLESSKDQVGTLVISETIQILRITPTYLVSVTVPFDGYTPGFPRNDTPVTIRDAALKDLIKLVDSVHVSADH